MASKPKYQRTILWASLMIAINSVIAQQIQAVETANTPALTEQADNVVQLNTIVVTATAEEEKPIAKVTSGVNKEDIDRRGATNVVDLLDQISNVSLNGLYARPDISVAIQGIGGRGRVNQSLEGIQQSFEAFTHNFNQSGTILINPAFLRSIDVTQGATSDASSIGNLAGSANFSYVNVDDVLAPEQDIGGIFRLQSGIGEWENGQNLTRTGLFAARGDQWEVLLGASKGSNEDYHMGKNVDRDDFLKYTNSNWGGTAYQELDPALNNGQTWSTYGVPSYSGDSSAWIHRTTGGAQGSPIGFGAIDSGILDGLQSAASNSVYPGTFRETEGYLLKAKYSFNDEYDQSLALFATKTEAHSQSDVNANLRIPTITGGAASFLSPAYYVDNRTEAQVYSLKYDAKFSDLINPNITVFHQRMKRTQLWPNEGFYIPVTDMKDYSSHMDTKSTGINLGNGSHFNTAWLGALTLNTALQYKHDKHVPKDFTQNEAMVYGTLLENKGTYLGKWNPDSKADSLAFSFDLNNHENDSLWKWNIGAGIQRVKTQAIDAVIETGNIAKEGTIYNYLAFQPEHITASSSAVRRNWRNGIIDPNDTVALAAYQAWRDYLVDSEIRYDTTKPYSSYIFLTGQDPEHSWNLKAGNLGLQYTFANTGLSLYGTASYGERAPTSTEMYMYGNYYKGHIIQSRFLEPESNLSLQLGLNYIRDGLFTNDDSLSVNTHLYQNKINNYILMAYHQNADSLPASSYDYAETENGTNPYHLGYWGYTNNTSDWITRGLGLDFNYKQPVFYLRGSVTIPFEKKNQHCWNEFQGGNGYYQSQSSDGTTFSSAGTGRHVCGNPYKWFMYQTIDPVQASLTAAITPFDGKLELGTTLNYRAKQRSYFYVDAGATDTSGNSPYQLGDWGEWNRFPQVLKVDLFASYKFSDQLKAGLYLANATDQMDMIPWGEYADVMPGRTLTASLEYRHGDGRNIFGTSRLSEDYNWTGWHTGIGISDSKFKLNTDSKSLTDNTATIESGLFDAKTTRYDLHLGYDLQLKDSPWVVGVEAGISDGTSSGISRGDSTQYTYVARENSNSYSIPTASVQYDFDLGASLRSRLGYSTGRTLFYGFAGTSLQKVKQSRTQYQMSAAGVYDIYGTKIDPSSQAMFSESDSESLFGWNVGLGVEHAITDNLSLRAEYNYADLGSVSSQFDNARTDATIDYQKEIREQVVFGTWPNGRPKYETVTRYENVDGGYKNANGRKNSTDIKNHSFGLSLNWRF